MAILLSVLVYLSILRLILDRAIWPQIIAGKDMKKNPKIALANASL